MRRSESSSRQPLGSDFAALLTDIVVERFRGAA